MQHELRFTGVSHTPSDYDCPEGSLALSINVISEDAALKPINKPSVIIDQIEGLQVIYIHQTSAYKHYIVDGGDGDLWWGGLQEVKDAGATNRHSITHLHHFRGIKQISHIGNTLIVLDDEGMHYLLYQSGYKYLGTQVPEVKLSLGLQREDMYQYNGNNHLITSGGGAYDRELKPYVADVEVTNLERIDGTELSHRSIHKRLVNTDVADKVIPKVNKMLAERVRDKDLFVFPFFVRYALRLYDGTLTRHSAPILMIPNSSAPLLSVLPNDKVLPDAFVGRLMYQTHLQAELSAWGDIVRSVDVFVSAPIYTYDQNYKPEENDKGEPYYMVLAEDIVQYSIGSPKSPRDIEVDKRVSASRGITLEPISYERFRTVEKLESSIIIGAEHFATAPSLPDEKIEEAIRSAGQFYLVGSIPLEEFQPKQGASSTQATELRPLKIKKGTLTVLQTQEVMTDDYASHEQLIPELAFVYNARLNLSGIKRKTYRGYQPESATAYLSARQRTQVFVYLKQDGRDIIVERSGELDLSSTYYYYYPSPKAYKVVFVQGSTIVEHQMQRHDFLSGAYVFNGLNKPLSEGTTRPASERPYYSASADLYYNELNKLYTSEVNNPFLFPARSINTIGTGTIVGISSATKALSQGQYGQFPLYAFTTEGVWALEVGANGAFSSKHPTSRDVCINPKSITQTDTAVLFVSQRGMMMLSGSEVRPLSDALMGTPYLLADTEVETELRQLSGYEDALGSSTSFEECLPQLRMLYDYTNARIIAYTPQARGDEGKRLAYVYSLKSGQWAMTTTQLQYSLASYPEALAVDTQGRLLDYATRGDANQDDTPQRGLVATRPFSLMGRSELKTVRGVVMRGIFGADAVQLALLATRDYLNWELVASSRDYRLVGFSGSPFRVYRLVMLTSLKPRECISSASIDYTPRLGDKLR